MWLAIACDDKLANPENGHVKIVMYGSTAKYTCSSGFDVVGDDTRMCEGGSWTGQAPGCAG